MITYVVILELSMVSPDVVDMSVVLYVGNSIGRAYDAQENAFCIFPASEINVRVESWQNGQNMADKVA